jgi:hypothetical protein
MTAMFNTVVNIIAGIFSKLFFPLYALVSVVTAISTLWMEAYLDNFWDTVLTALVDDPTIQMSLQDTVLASSVNNPILKMTLVFCLLLIPQLLILLLLLVDEDTLEKYPFGKLLTKSKLEDYIDTLPTTNVILLIGAGIIVIMWVVNPDLSRAEPFAQILVTYSGVTIYGINKHKSEISTRRNPTESHPLG